MAHDVFISYTVSDRTIANAICARLEEAGVRCWIAPRDVTPGEPYAKEIVRAIPDSRIMVLVFSGEANRSPQVLREVERAVDKRVAILPFRVEDVAPVDELEFYIKSQHWLDAVTPPLDKHIDHLVHTVRQLRERWVKPSAVIPTRPTEQRPAPVREESPPPSGARTLADAPAAPATAARGVAPTTPTPGPSPRDMGTIPLGRNKLTIAAVAAAVLIGVFALLPLFSGDDNEPGAADTAAVESQLSQIENQRQAGVQRMSETDPRAYIDADSVLADALSRLDQFRGDRVPAALRSRVTQLDSSVTASRSQVRTACAADPTSSQCPGSPQ